MVIISSVGSTALRPLNTRSEASLSLNILASPPATLEAVLTSPAKEASNPISIKLPFSVTCAAPTPMKLLSSIEPSAVIVPV